LTANQSAQIQIREPDRPTHGTIDQVDYDPQAIGVGRDARQRNQPAVARVVGALRCHNPTRQQVGEGRRHGGSVMEGHQ